MKDIFNTYGMAVTPYAIVGYCYNRQVISIEEILQLEYETQVNAMIKKQKLFKVFETEQMESIVFCLN